MDSEIINATLNIEVSETSLRNVASKIKDVEKQLIELANVRKEIEQNIGDKRTKQGKENLAALKAVIAEQTRYTTELSKQQQLHTAIATGLKFQAAHQEKLAVHAKAYGLEYSGRVGTAVTHATNELTKAVSLTKILGSDSQAYAKTLRYTATLQERIATAVAKYDALSSKRDYRAAPQYGVVPSSTTASASINDNIIKPINDGDFAALKAQYAALEAAAVKEKAAIVQSNLAIKERIKLQREARQAAAPTNGSFLGLPSSDEIIKRANTAKLHQEQWIRDQQAFITKNVALTKQYNDAMSRAGTFNPNDTSAISKANSVYTEKNAMATRRLVTESERYLAVEDKIAIKVARIHELNRQGVLVGERYTRALEAQDKILARQQNRTKRTSTATGSGTANGRAGFYDTMMGEDADGEPIGTSFGHKIATTAQYATAGMAVYAFMQAMQGAMKTSIEFDHATRTLSAVLDKSLGSTRALGDELVTLGTRFGGTLSSIYEVANALGRAGIKFEDISKATEITMKMARLTGDTFEESTKAIISYQQVFGDTHSIEQLGDKLAFVANASRLSTQDISTLSNYALSAAKKIGLTVDAVGAMSAAFSNAGVNASTIGTQIRRFSDILVDDGQSIKDFFFNIGYSQKNLLKDLQGDTKTSNAAIKDFAASLARLTNKEFAQYTAGLDILATDSLAKLRQNSSEFSSLLDKSINDSTGNLDKTSVIMDGFLVRWESFINTIKNASSTVVLPLADALGDALGEFELRFKAVGNIISGGSGYDFAILENQYKILQIQKELRDEASTMTTLQRLRLEQELRYLEASSKEMENAKLGVTNESAITKALKERQAIVEELVALENSNEVDQAKHELLVEALRLTDEILFSEEEILEVKQEANKLVIPEVTAIAERVAHAKKLVEYGLDYNSTLASITEQHTRQSEALKESLRNQKDIGLEAYWSIGEFSNKLESVSEIVEAQNKLLDLRNRLIEESAGATAAQISANETQINIIDNLLGKLSTHISSAEAILSLQNEITKATEETNQAETISNDNVLQRLQMQYSANEALLNKLQSGKSDLEQEIAKRNLAYVYLSVLKDREQTEDVIAEIKKVELDIEKSLYEQSIGLYDITSDRLALEKEITAEKTLQYGQHGPDSMFTAGYEYSVTTPDTGATGLAGVISTYYENKIAHEEALAEEQAQALQEAIDSQTKLDEARQSEAYTLTKRLELLSASNDEDELAIKRKYELNELTSVENATILEAIYAREDEQKAIEDSIQAQKDWVDNFQSDISDVLSDLNEGINVLSGLSGLSPFFNNVTGVMDERAFGSASMDLTFSMLDVNPSGSTTDPDVLQRFVDATKTYEDVAKNYVDNNNFADAATKRYWEEMVNQKLAEASHLARTTAATLEVTKGTVEALSQTVTDAAVDGIDAEEKINITAQATGIEALMGPNGTTSLATVVDKLDTVINGNATLNTDAATAVNTMANGKTLSNLQIKEITIDYDWYYEGGSLQSGTNVKNGGATTKYTYLDKGGYTGDGSGPRDASGYKQAGIVHEDEWVAPKWMVDTNPMLFDRLESARVNKGFANGGYTSGARAISGVASDDIVSILKDIKNLQITMAANSVRQLRAQRDTVAILGET